MRLITFIWGFSDIKRKTLPAISRGVGLSHEQTLLFPKRITWKLERWREARLNLLDAQHNPTKQWLNTPIKASPTVRVKVGEAGVIYLLVARRLFPNEPN